MYELQGSHLEEDDSTRDVVEVQKTRKVKFEVESLDFKVDPLVKDSTSKSVSDFAGNGAFVVYEASKYEKSKQRTLSWRV